MVDENGPSGIDSSTDNELTSVDRFLWHTINLLAGGIVGLITMAASGDKLLLAVLASITWVLLSIAFARAGGWAKVEQAVILLCRVIARPFTITLAWPLKIIGRALDKVVSVLVGVTGGIAALIGVVLGISVVAFVILGIVGLLWFGVGQLF